MKFYGIENKDSFKPTNVDFFAKLEEATLIGLINATKDSGETSLPTNYITDIYSQPGGLKSLINENNSTSGFDPTSLGRYYIGSSNKTIETNNLYDSATAITRLVVTELASTYDSDYASKTQVEVSLDNGGTWSTNTANLGLITDFSGTSNGGLNDRLKLRFTILDAFGWGTTSSLNVGRVGLAGSGTKNNVLSFGGHSGAYAADSEIWAGSSWATTTVLNVAKQDLAGCGSIVGSLAIGGYSGASIAGTEIWSGSSWATTSVLPNATYGLGACGSTSDALSFGGFILAETAIANIWSGAAWATTTSLNSARDYISGCGSTSYALSFGGQSVTVLSDTEIWHGISWATTNGLNIARLGAGACGNISNALCVGGFDTAETNNVERWNGYSWSGHTVNMVSSRDKLGTSGSTSGALSFGGESLGAATPITERFFGFQQLGFGVKIN